MKRCPLIDEIERALNGGPDSESLRAHLADCPKCRNRARRIEVNNDFLRSLRDNDSFSLDAAARSADSHEARQTPVIERFELLRELHRGGQGVVYLARQTATRRVVAIKLLLAASLATSRQRRRFEREIEIAAGLRHSQIVTVFESGTTAGGWLWFAMEYVEGVSLDVHLNQKRPPMNEILQLIASVCDAVAYAHQRGIIHRDLKPANIVVDHNGLPHILDFGLAKATGSAVPDATAGATRTGEFMGTFAYAAPEQFHGAPHQIDTRTDVYALGTILYEALTGKHPFPASGSLAEFVRAVDQRDVVRPSSIAPGISTELEAVVLCALAREPARRYQSAGSLGQDLQRFLAGEPVEARRDSRWYLLRRVAHRHRVAMSAAAAFMLVAVGFAVLSTVQARRVARERDKAVVAERAAAQTAESLAETLSKSNIERGRLLVRSGNIPLGEQMIWREWRASPIVPRSGTPWPPDDDAYWALWELYSRSPCRQALRVVPGAKPKLAISPDTRLLAVSDNAETLKLWNLPELTPLRDLGPVPGGVTALAFSPRQDLLATGDERGNLTLWNVSTGTVARRFSPETAPVRNISFTGDGELIVIHYHRQYASALTLDGRRQEFASLHRKDITCIEAAPTGRRIVIGGEDGSLAVVDLAKDDPNIQFPKSAGSLKLILAMRFAPDEKSLAVGRWDGATEVWDISSKRLVWKNRLHNGATLALDFSPDGSRLASGGRDRTVCISNAADGRVLRTFNGHTDVMTGACFFDQASRLVTSSADSLIRIWDLDDNPGVRLLTRHGRTAFHVAFSPDGRQVASCGAGEEPVRVHDARTGTPIATLIGHGGIVSGGAFSPNGAQLATCGFDREVRLWSLADAACLSVLKGHENFVESVAFCLNGTRLASASDDSTVRMWDITSKSCAAILRGHAGRCPMLAVSPDGRTIASCSVDETIRLWSAEDGSAQGVLVGHRMPIRTVCFTPDGKLLLSGGDETTIRVWDIATKQCIATLEGNDQDVFCVTASPDGRFIASTTRGGSVQLWSLARRRSLATLSDGHGSVFSICFSPDGRTLATCGEDGWVRLMDLSYFDAHMNGNRDVQETIARVSNN